MELHSLLLQKRKEFNLTQQQVAEKLGIETSTYAHYESGRRKPNTEKLKKLSEMYNLTDEILDVLPIINRPEYNAQNIQILKEVLREVSLQIETSKNLLGLHKTLQDAYNPVVKEKFEQMEMPELKKVFRNIPSGQTVEVAILDYDVELLLNDAIQMDLKILEMFNKR